jgi:hypothetical protein
VNTDQADKKASNAGDGQLERLKEFARWLVSMDDPQDAIGCTERQSVTLTKIIDRARQALGEDA